MNTTHIILVLFTLLSVSAFADSNKRLHAKSIAFGHASPTGELHKKLVLTFDDGPNANTEKVLEVLDLYSDALEKAGKERINATFFINGNKVAKYNYRLPNEKYANELLNIYTTKMQTVDAIVNAKVIMRGRFLDTGHILANHSVSHSKLWTTFMDTSREIIQDEIKLTHDAVEEYMSDITDCSNKWLFRAPYGGWREKNAGDANAEESVVKKYIGPILWDIGNRVTYYPGTKIPNDAADWECKSLKKSAKFCARGYLNKTYGKTNIGGIVLMHDIHSITAEMLYYTLRVWTGINPYDRGSAMHTKLEKFVKDYKFENSEVLKIVGLNELKALNKYDDRFKAGGSCSI